MKTPPISDLLARRKPGYALEQAFYTDPDIFRMDMETIFYRDWLFVAPACDLPKPGSYITHQVGDYGVIIVRGQDGAIRAFHNSCRHRGSVLCKASKGTNPKIVCPYHQWTYELDGRLLWAREMGDDFDPSQHGLKTVHCRELAGLVYICLAPVAPGERSASALVGDDFETPIDADAPAADTPDGDAADAEADADVDEAGA